MKCSEARTYLLDRRRGKLSTEMQAAVEAHLESCESCRREDAADRELSLLLESRLPRPRAPESLRHTVEAQWSPLSAFRLGGARRVRSSVSAMALGAAIAVAAIFAWRARSNSDAMFAEAVNDHLRILYSDHPLEVESSDRHQVKPWFEGRVDFAPEVPFSGDSDFPLQGGAVGYFVDRKAATFVFKRRLHLITLFVFRAEGLPWAVAATEPVGRARATMQTSRGFHVLLWRDGDLGYAIVSDVDEHDLRALANKIARQD
jgi:anti-sigma factor RsiW